MKYYKDKDGEIYAFESDGSQDSFIDPELELLDEVGLAEARAAQAAANAPTAEQLLAAANAQRNSLLANASLRVAPLQYAVDLDTATAHEVESLKLWKQYMVSVNRVPDQPQYPKTITWPVPPGE